MRKTAFISDLLFTLLLSFFLSVVIFRLMRVSFAPSVFLGGVCSALSTLGIGTYLSYRRKKYYLKRSDEAQKNKLLTHLVLLSADKKLQFFRSIFPNARFQNLRIITDKETYFLCFHFSPVTKDEVVQYTHLKTPKRKILLCNQIDNDAFSLCSTFDIEVWAGERVYLFIKEHQALPIEFLGEEKAKRKFKLRLCFAKSNARRFLISGVFILLASLFTPFPLYYQLFGALLLCISAGIRIFGYTSP